MSLTELMLRLSAERDAYREQAACVAEAFFGDGEKRRGPRLSAEEQQRELARLKEEFRLN